MTKPTKQKIAEIKDKIADFEYVKNGMHRLNGTSVDVRNIRVRKEDKAIVDIILIFEDRQEKYNEVEYDLKLLEARE